MDGQEGTDSCSLKAGHDFVVVDSSIPEFQTIGIVEAHEYKDENIKCEKTLTENNSSIDPKKLSYDAKSTNINTEKIARSSLKPVFDNLEAKTEKIARSSLKPVFDNLEGKYTERTKANKLKFAIDQGIEDNIINEELICTRIKGTNERICKLRPKLQAAPLKVKFTVEDVAARSDARLNDLLDKTRYTDVCTILSKSKVQTLTLVKEKPSSEYACVLGLHENEITLHPNKQIKINKSEDSEEEFWEIEPGFQIFKSLDPVPYRPNRSKLGILDTKSQHIKEFKKLDLKAEGDKLILGSTHCSEFLAPVEVADLFVSSTIGHAKDQYYFRVMNYGDPDMKRLSSLVLHLKVNSNWSSIKHMTKEQGIYHIERYIVITSELNEDWKYTIRFKGVQSDKVSDHYFYEANFSLPSKLYPVAQVTAAVFFHMEVSRVIPPRCPIKTILTIEGSRLKINPDKFTLRDNTLLRVLNTKLQLIKNCTI